MKRPISFKEACERPCALKLTRCGRPTVSGLDGFACENCLSHMVEQFDLSAVDGVRCGYCGSSPAYFKAHHTPVCALCAKQALQTARGWYEHGAGNA